MSKFSKQFNLWHIVNDKKYRTATLYRKALCKKFRNWKSPEDYSELTIENEKLKADKLKADKQLVVVPKFVDDAIRSLSNGYRSAFDAIYLIKGKVEQYKEMNSDWIEVYDWIFEGGNSGIFERAFLDGYTVEKEKLYRVVFLKLEDDDEHLLFKSGEDYFFDLATNQDGYWEQHFTEKEIKAIDERYWPFAVLVDEVTDV